jgi:hypothetical protein
MPPAKLLETYDLGTRPFLKAEKWSSPHRHTGRQLVVKDAAGATVFDTGTCFCFANALDSFSVWLNAQVALGNYTTLV